MQNKRNALLRKGGWIFISGLILFSLLLGGCSNNDLQKQVQSLTQEKTDLQTQAQTLTQDKTELQKQVQTLTQDKAALQKQVSAVQNALKVDSVATASSVTMTNGQLDWRKYVPQKSFASGYKGGLWVMFSFSNMLHDKAVNIKADIYLLSKGETRAVKNKASSLTDTTDNTLWWGDVFDISAFPDGDYTAILTVTDVIAGTAAAQMTTFNIGAAK